MYSSIIANLSGVSRDVLTRSKNDLCERLSRSLIFASLQLPQSGQRRWL